MSMSKLLIVTPLMKCSMQQWGTLLYNLQVPNLTPFAGFNDNWKILLALLSNKTKQMLGSKGIMFVSGPGAWTRKSYPKQYWPLMLKLGQDVLALRSTMQIIVKMHGLKAVLLEKTLT